MGWLRRPRRQRNTRRGDSYAAGPLIPLQVPPFGCLKSNNNYSHLASRRLRLALTDPSCSSAETEDLTNPQNVDPDGPNPLKFNSLYEQDPHSHDPDRRERHRLLEQSPATAPARRTKGRRARTGTCHDGRDEISERIQATAPLVAAVIRGIHARSPKARVYVRAKQNELNAMVAAQAAAGGAGLIDWYTASIGHDACQPPVIRWVESVVPVNAATPLHPNLGGMMGASDLRLAALRL